MVAVIREKYTSFKIDQYVIMPNYIHMIMLLGQTTDDSKRATISDIVCTYKSLTTRICKKANPIDKRFQTSFYEHVIRGQKDYNEIAEYIANNPKQWELDKLFPMSIADSDGNSKDRWFFRREQAPALQFELTD